jgi:hypothetical protein
MNENRRAARERVPLNDEGRIAWPFGAGFPSSDPQPTPPKGASRCAHSGRSGA